MKRARVSRPQCGPMLQGGIGCVVLAILLALLNACSESPVAPPSPATSSVVVGDAARAVAVAIALAAEEEEDVELAGDHSGLLQVTIKAAEDRQLRLEFVDYSDDGVSFLDGAMTVTRSEAGVPHIRGDLQIHMGQGEPESVDLDGEIISLPGGGTMTLVIDWPGESGGGDQADTDSDQISVDQTGDNQTEPGQEDPALDADLPDSEETDADVVPPTIRLSDSAQAAVWRTIREVAEEGAGVHAGNASGHVRVRLTRTVTATETDRVTDVEAHLRFEQFAASSRFSLGGALRVRSRRDTQGRFRLALESDLRVYTHAGVAAFTPDTDVVRQWLEERQIVSEGQVSPDLLAAVVSSGTTAAHDDS